MNRLNQFLLICSFRVVLIIVLLFASATFVLAQDSEPAPIPDISQPIDYVATDTALGALVNQILNLLQEYFYIPAAAGFVIMGTGFFGRFILKTTPAEFIVFGIMAVVFIFYTIAGNIEQTESLQSIVDLVTQLGDVLLAATITGIGSSKLHKSANTNGVAIAGFKRSQVANG